MNIIGKVLYKIGDIVLKLLRRMCGIKINTSKDIKGNMDKQEEYDRSIDR